jgi:DNA mismatch repair protein MSH6
MPPQSKPSAELSRQKILTSFFSKASAGAGAGSGQVVKPAPAAKNKTNVATPKLQDKYQNQASSSPVYPKTPESRSFNVHALNSSVAHPSSVISSRRASSPPTSDPIDVDMLGSDVGEPQTAFVNSVGTTKMRSLLINESDYFAGYSEPPKAKGCN